MMCTFLAFLTVISLSPTPAADVATGPATGLALQWYDQQCDLARMEALFQPTHPQLISQRVRVQTLQRALQRVVQEGHRVDDGQVIRAMNERLQRARVEVALARQLLTPSHPKMALLELRLQVEVQTQKTLLHEVAELQRSSAE